MAAFAVLVRAREAEMKDLDEWVRNDEVRERGVDRGRVITAAEVKSREVGKSEGEELDERIIGWCVADGYGQADISQRFTRRVHEGKDGRWMCECVYTISERRFSSKRVQDTYQDLST